MVLRNSRYYTNAPLSGTPHACRLALATSAADGHEPIQGHGLKSLLPSPHNGRTVFIRRPCVPCLSRRRGIQARLVQPVVPRWQPRPAVRIGVRFGGPDFGCAPKPSQGEIRPMRPFSRLRTPPRHARRLCHAARHAPGGNRGRPDHRRPHVHQRLASPHLLDRAGQD